MDTADERAAVVHVAEMAAMVHMVMSVPRGLSDAIFGILDGNGLELLFAVLALVVPFQVVRRLGGVPERFLFREMRDVVLGPELHVVRHDRAETRESEELGYAALHLVASRAHARGRENHRPPCLRIVHWLPEAERADLGRRDDDAQRCRTR